jgi:hypothetical protein
MTAIGAVEPAAPQGRPDLARALRALPFELSAAYVAYLVFGLCLILNCQVDSDGTWYFYGKLLHRGVRLYTDLRLPQQPLFILVTAWWQLLFGNSWLLSLLPSALNLGLFTHGFYLLARRSNWLPWQQAVVFLGSAFAAIAWNSYRFDDYRILSDILALYTVLLLIRLLDGPADRALPYSWPLGLGVLSGLSFTTRANDGLLLLISVAAILFHGFPRQRIRLLSLLIGGATLTALAVVLLTGDSLGAYVKYTLLASPASKGGVGQLIFSPLMLAIDLAKHILEPDPGRFEIVFLIAAGMPVVAGRLPIYRGALKPLAIAVAVVFVGLFGCLVVAIYNRLSYDCIANVVLPLFMVALGALSVWAGLAVLHIVRINNRLATLILVPFGALIAGGMSSGGKQFGVYGPVGLFMAIMPIVFTLQRPVAWGRAYVLSVYALVASAICLGKIERPLMWNFYRAQPMFVDRAIINHPIYGPMLVDRTMNGFFDGTCRTIRSSTAKPELLSLPYSYANYYCGIEPWGMYVQTFFDTSNAETIRKITKDLGSQPPTWVLYQRQLKVLRLNEIFFNHGQRSPHHDLDDFIEGQVGRGTWKIVSRWSEQPGNDWQLIRTSAAP